jgi:hypothetical protein
VTAKLTAIPANRSDETRTQANKKICPIEQRSAVSAAKGAQMDGEKGPKRTALEFEIPAIDALFVAVVETTEDAVINALCATRTIEGRDGHRVEALPVDETIAIVRRYEIDVSASLL